MSGVEAVLQAFQRSAKKAGANEFTCIEVRTESALAISDLVDTLRAQLEAAELRDAQMQDAAKLLLARAEAAEAECARLREDAARYRWMRNPSIDVALVLDKVTGFVEYDEGSRTGGYHTYEYRAGEELDAAIDAARTKEQQA